METKIAVEIKEISQAEVNKLSRELEAKIHTLVLEYEAKFGGHKYASVLILPETEHPLHRVCISLDWRNVKVVA